MAVAVDASSPAAVYIDNGSTTALTTATFTPPAGAILLAVVVSADGGQTHSTPTATGHTFAARPNVGTNSASARVSLWTAVATGAAITVTATFAGSLIPHGLVVVVLTGAQLAATPAVATFDGNAGANSAPTLNITTAAAGSIVVWGLADWSAIDGTSTKAYRSSATERSFHFFSGQYTVYVAWQNAAAAGSQTFGLTAPTGQKPTMAGIEIQASGAPAAVPPILTMPPWRT